VGKGALLRAVPTRSTIERPDGVGTARNIGGQTGTSVRRP
jgi:hypothetical protein